MSTPSQPSPDDPEQRLRSGLRSTTPAFETRWTELKRQLRQEPAPRPPLLAFNWRWLLLPAGAALALTAALLLRPPPSTPTLSASTLASYGELLSLDTDLRNALPLTDAETLETLLSAPLSDATRS